MGEYLLKFFAQIGYLLPLGRYHTLTIDITTDHSTLSNAICVCGVISTSTQSETAIGMAGPTAQ